MPSTLRLSLALCVFLAILFLRNFLQLVNDVPHSMASYIPTAPHLSVPEDDAAAPQEPRARICYTILASGAKEVERVLNLLPLIQSPSAVYFIHLDLKTPARARKRLADAIAWYPDVVLLEPAMPVSWGGLSVLLAAVFGLARSTKWEWDFWINLSASDMPLLTQDEISRVLGRYIATNTSFVSGEHHVGDWDEATQGRRPPRTRFFFEDKRLYRVPSQHVSPDDAVYALGKNEGRTFDARNLAYRDEPEHFAVYKGHFWVVLHRSFAEYVVKAPDNVARLLLAYCSSLQVPDELYFQTVACHPLRPTHMPVLQSSLRCIPPFHSGAHPAPWTHGGVAEAIRSGRLFSRKFRSEEGSADAAYIADIVRALKMAERDANVSDARVRAAWDYIEGLSPLCAGDARVGNGWSNGRGEKLGGGDPAAVEFLAGVSEPSYSTTTNGG